MTRRLWTTLSTPSELERLSLRDIRRAIALIEDFIVGQDESSFSRDLKTYHAVTRCLEIISEASRRLSPETRSRSTTVPWHAIMAAGNVYRHEYHKIFPARVWQTASGQLEPLRAFVAAELGSST